jgi:hypothetical protein
VIRLDRHPKSRFRDRTTLLDVTFALVGVVSLAALTFSLASEYLKDPKDERRVRGGEAIQRSFDPSDKQREPFAPRGIIDPLPTFRDARREGDLWSPGSLDK